MVWAYIIRRRIILTVFTFAFFDESFVLDIIMASFTIEPGPKFKDRMKLWFSKIITPRYTMNECFSDGNNNIQLIQLKV